jgi:hypothetical protein
MIDKLIEKILQPDKEFTPIPFWFLNDELSDDEIVRQLCDFKEKGVDGVVLHPRIGIPESISYLSDKYMNYIKLAIETAASLNMYIVLYDEAMYPSGSAHGMVVAENPKFASQVIVLTRKKFKGKLIAKCGGGRYIVQVPSKGTIRGIHFGEDDGEKNSPPSADLLSKDAVDTFIRLTHQRYYDVLGEYFGNTVIGFFTDEPSLKGRNAIKNSFAWTWDFEKEFTEKGGNLKDLEALFTGEENDSTRLYHNLILQRERDVYYGSLSKFCKGHGVALMGHPHFGDDIELEECFDIPGQDMVLRWLAPEKDPLSGCESAQGKCSSDSARVHGKRRNSNECFGACNRDNVPWYLSGADIKWYIDYLGVRGVNMFIPHSFYYSIKGKRKNERPPDVGPNNIWWKHYLTISDYIKRISFIMTDCVNEAKVCVMCQNRDMHTDEVRQFYENQVEFNYLPYCDFSEDMIKNGKLIVGNNSYDYIYCDDKNFVSINKISSVADLPYRDIYTDVPCRNLRVTRLKKDSVRMIFLTNEGNEDIKTTASIDGETALIAMNLWNGKHWKADSTTQDGKTYFRLRLGTRESLLLILDEKGNFDAPVLVKKRYTDVDFELISEDKEQFTKTYKGILNIDTLPEDKLFVSVKAEEMAECFVNDCFAGFSLWNNHEFDLSNFIRQGRNEITLVVTGSAANRYGNHKIDYGLNDTY